ncbi:hypothetical protein HA402_005966 [Bradysia odoriphaga]|nr:hypothetical protein HA402_005966 [Bradysia odoriphaga]
MAGLESMITTFDEKPSPVDREKIMWLPTCPLLLRVFCSTGRHHSTSEFGHGNVPSNELQIYTWQDATLQELTTLVRDVNPETRRKGTYFDFALVQPEQFGPGYRMRDIGVTCSGQRNADDTLTLAQAKFNIGDYMDINITPPNRVPPQRRARPY